MLIILACVFVVLFLLIGGNRGAISLLSLIGNILVFMLAVTLMSWELNPIVVTIIAGLVINGITLFYQNGKNEKTFVAAISVMITFLVLIGIVYFVGANSHMTGLNEIEIRSELVLSYSLQISIDMKLVVISMILIGMIGAIMDISIAISSAVFEIHQQNSHLSKKDLCKSGITIGKDILGTSLNTLYFAYMGESMILLLYMRKFQYSLVDMINSKSFLQELICILFSGIGCVISIPLCATIAAYMYKKPIHIKKNKEKI